MSVADDTTRVALVQLCATTDVAANLATCEKLIRDAAAQGARIVLLPEAFAFIGPDRLKREIVEPITPDDPAAAPILARLQALSRELGVELVLGGHHETGPQDDADGPRSFNTCVHLDSSGQLRARYRKIHL